MSFYTFLSFFWSLENLEKIDGLETLLYAILLSYFDNYYVFLYYIIVGS